MDSMDTLSEMLSGVRLNGALYFHAEFTAPWAVQTPAAAELARILAPGAPHLVIYHFVIAGRACVRLPDATFLELEAGDVVIFPHGDPHVISSDRDSTQCRESGEVLRKVVNRDLTLLKAGGGGAATRVVCGYMVCDSHLSRTVLSGLPSCFKVNVRMDRSGGWLEGSIHHLVEEAARGGAGSQAMLSKLSEALFVDTLRRYVSGLTGQQKGWLAGTQDSVIGRSLSLLHQRVRDPWTLAGLAREVGLSRSALVERFTRHVSEPPMTYLTRWRLHLAAGYLKGSSRSVAEIASEVGYESEAAFNRAFKREFGSPPARFRRESRAQMAPRLAPEAVSA